MNSTSFPAFVNVPALVSHQPTLPRDEPPPADAAPVLHRGSLTCASALKARLAGCSAEVPRQPPEGRQGEACKALGRT